MEFKIDNRTNANAAIDSFILAGDNSWKHKYIGNAEVPYCDHRNRLICSPAMPPMLNEDDDRMVRAKNEHEAGHARFTPEGMDESWSRLKCKLVNVVEDLRIERLVGGLSDVFKKDLHWLNDKLIDKIQNKMRAGEKKCKPVDEAIMALHFEGNGHSPKWTMSDEALALHDSAKATFDKWTGITGEKSAFPQVLDIVDEIIAIWEKQKQDQQNGENGQDSEDKQDNKQQQNGQGNGQSGDGQDDNQQDGQDGDDNQQNGENKKQNKQDSQKDSSRQDGGSNDGNDGNSQKENGSKSNGSANSGDDDDDETNGTDNADDGGESDDDGDSNGEAGNDESNDGDEEEDGGDYDGQDGDGDGQDAAGDEEDGEGDEDASRTNNGDVEPSSDAKEKKIDELLETDDDSMSISEQLKEEWKKAVQNSEEVFGEYTSYTDKDAVIRAKENETGYNTARDEVRGAISTITGHLEQSLRTLSRCRTIHGKDMGPLDMSRMAVIAKSLDKNIFTGRTKGVSLDVAVSILIDESGSIGSTCYDFRRMAIAFCEALERLGIKFEVLGHTTGYESGYGIHGFTRTMPMKIYEHKCFDEPYRSERYRIGSIGSENCNIDGEALLYTVKRLLAQRANRHIVMVLSDGLPNQCRNTLALCNHLGNVVELCRKKLGVEVYAFGIGTKEPERYYGKENFVYLRNGKELDHGFIGRFSNIIINRKM